MKNFKLSLLLALLFFSAFFVSTQKTFGANIKEQTLVKIADVNIENVKIKSRQNNEFKISFDIANGEMVQPQIRYGVRIMKKEGLSMVVYNEKIYDETLVIASKEKMHKEIEYTAPSFLEGEYDIYIFSQNEKNLSLALVFAGKQAFSQISSGFMINQGSCFIKGDKELKNLGNIEVDRNVFVSPNENLTISCKIKNISKEEESLFYGIETRSGSIFGERVFNKTEKSNNNFKPGEERDIDFIFNVGENSGRFFTKINVKNTSTENKEDNFLRINFTVSGPFALMQNIRFDKSSYVAGEKSNISLSIINSKEASRFVLNVVINDDKGKMCSENFKKEFEKKASSVEEITLNVSIIKDCKNPAFSFKLSDASGKIYDKNTFNLKNPSNSFVESATHKLTTTIFIVLVVVCIIFFVIIFLKYKNNRKILIFIFSCLGYLGLFTFGVKAATFASSHVVDTYNSSGTKTGNTTNANFTYIVNFNPYSVPINRDPAGAIQTMMSYSSDSNESIYFTDMEDLTSNANSFYSTQHNNLLQGSGPAGGPSNQMYSGRSYGGSFYRQLGTFTQVGPATAKFHAYWNSSCYDPSCRDDFDVPFDIGAAEVAAATCSDGVQNGGETGIDCGGSCPACTSSCTDTCSYAYCGQACTYSNCSAGTGVCSYCPSIVRGMIATSYNNITKSYQVGCGYGASHSDADIMAGMKINGVWKDCSYALMSGNTGNNITYFYDCNTGDVPSGTIETYCAVGTTSNIAYAGCKNKLTPDITINPPSNYNLQVSADQNTTVKSKIGTSINCISGAPVDPGFCSYDYPAGSTVVLNGTTSLPNVFSWEGCDSVSGSDCTVLMNSAKIIRAKSTCTETIDCAANTCEGNTCSGLCGPITGTKICNNSGKGSGTWKEVAP
jgi:hypothetical protein